MRLHLKPLDLTAAVLVFAAALVWSLYFGRVFRSRPPAAVVAVHSESPRPANPVVPPPKSLPEATPAAPPSPESIGGFQAELDALRGETSRPARAKLYARLSKLVWPAEMLAKVKAFVRDTLRSDPSDFDCLDLLLGFPEETQVAALLEFARESPPKETRCEVFKRATARTRYPGQVEKIGELYAVETDEDIRAIVLLGLESACPVVGKPLIRKGLLDESDEVRAIAVSTLNPASDADRKLLLGLAGTDPRERVRGSALLVLSGRLGDPEVLRLVLTKATADESAENRLEAVRVLQHESLKRNAAVLETLKLATRDVSEEVRALAQKAVQERAKSN